MAASQGEVNPIPPLTLAVEKGPVKVALLASVMLVLFREKNIFFPYGYQM
jgi:hypothetical protein